jgi:hypothetical protein
MRKIQVLRRLPKDYGWWESGIPIPLAAIDIEECQASPMNTTTTTDAADMNATAPTEGEQQQQQQTTTTIPPTPLLE